MPLLLDIPKENINIINHKLLQDGVNEDWDIDVISSIVLDNIASIDTIITFDDRGVSKHPNHIATFKGVESAVTILSM